MSEPLIRPIRAADDAAVAAIIRDVMASFGATGPEYSSSDPEVDAMSAAYDGARSACFVLVDGGRAFIRSDVPLRIARKIGGAWPLLSVFRLVPRPLRNWVYDWIASNRYRWFGKKEACWLPTPELKSRFLG